MKSAVVPSKTSSSRSTRSSTTTVQQLQETYDQLHYATGYLQYHEQAVAHSRQVIQELHQKISLLKQVRYQESLIGRMEENSRKPEKKIHPPQHEAENQKENLNLDTTGDGTEKKNTASNLTKAPLQEHRKKAVHFEDDSSSSLCLKKHSVHESFDKYLVILQHFYEYYGSFEIPLNYSIYGYSLGEWMQLQRELYEKGELSEERKDALQSIGFTWS